jgi:hypothetical protein
MIYKESDRYSVQCDRYILNLITGRAEASFDDKKSYNEWKEHWRFTAEKFMLECELEGLTATANSIREEIEWQMKW